MGSSRRSSLEELERQISAGEVLAKRTVHGRRHFLTAIKHRYIEAQHLLPQVPKLERLAAILLIQIEKARPCFRTCSCRIVSLSRSPCPSCFLLGNRVKQAPEDTGPRGALYGLSAAWTKPWGDSLCVRWVEGLLSVLRDVGALGRGADRERLLRYAVRPEVFSFHLWGLYNRWSRGRSLHESSFWRLLLLDEREARQITVAVVARGWWKLTTLGAAEEILPAFHSVDDWICMSWDDAKFSRFVDATLRMARGELPGYGYPHVVFPYAPEDEMACISAMRSMPARLSQAGFSNRLISIAQMVIRATGRYTRRELPESG